MSNCTFSQSRSPREQLKLISRIIPRLSIDMSFFPTRRERRWKQQGRGIVDAAGGLNTTWTAAVQSPVRSVRSGSVEIDLYALPQDALATDGTSNSGGMVVDHAQIQLLFWGGFWETASGPSADDITGAMSQLLASPFLSQLAQYGFQDVSLKASTIVLDNVPSPFSEDDVFDMVWTLIDQGNFPEPDDPGGRIIYLVIPPDGCEFDDATGRGAHNDALDDDVTEVLDRDHAWIGWSNHGTLDFISQVLSHELLEIISDPEPDSGWQMNRSINAGTEIGDACNNTGARPDGLLVQAYWSEAHKACIVPRWAHSMTLAYGDNEITGDTVIEEGKAVVTMCSKPDTYCYRRHRTTESVTLTATPHHFSTPDLVWSCGGQKITSGDSGAVNISTEVWTPQPHGATSSTRLVTVGVHASGMTLTLTNDPVGGMADGMFTFAVTATVYEAGTVSIDASDTAQLAFIGQYLEWDDQYAKDQITCIAEMIRKGRQLILQVGRRVDKGDPLPPWVDRLPSMLGERARGELREIGRMAHYLERAHPRFASELLRVGEISHGLPEGSLHVTGGDRR